MKQPNYGTPKESGCGVRVPEHAPEKALRFGEGNFPRAFGNRQFDAPGEKTGRNGKRVPAQPVAPGMAVLSDGSPWPRPLARTPYLW